MDRAGRLGITLGIALGCLLVLTTGSHAEAGPRGRADPAGTGQAEPSDTTVVRGQIVDAASGEPLASALVQVSGTSLATATAADGRFELLGVPLQPSPSTLALYVSVVGYGLVRRDVAWTTATNGDLTIPLARGASAYTEEVTVRGDTFRREAPGVPVQQSLDSRDLQELRGVLTDDPGRAIQVLPGVATSDDLRSEFTVRGSDFAHLNVVFDGVPNPFLFHTVRAVEDGGSIAAINADVLDAIVLLSGSYPQKFGGRLGAQIEFRPRDGSRDRRQLRGLVSGTAASLLAEGPIGATRRGSWLVSARRSYVDWLLKALEATNTAAFGFYDLFGRAVYDITPAHRIELSAIAGQSRATDAEPDPGSNNFRVGRHRTGLLSLGWTYHATPGLVVTQRGYASGASYQNTNLRAEALDWGADATMGWRSDVALTLSPTTWLEFGGDLQRVIEDRRQQRYTAAGLVRSIAELDEAGHRRGGYVLLRQSVGSRLVVSPGLRADWWSVVGRGVVAPSMQAEWRVSDATRLTFGSGTYAQAPTFAQQAQAASGSRLALERAVHADLGVERRLGPATRVQVAAFTRWETDLVWRPDADVRLVAGRIRQPSALNPYGNGLRGRARGVEALWQRRSSNGLTGWASYSWAHTQDTDAVSGEVFDRAVDQRHTLNMYGHYRLSSRLSVSAKLRAGDNMPIAGYVRTVGDAFVLGERRNEARAPAYARFDARANYVFNLSRRRLTLFAEVINVLGRANYRPADPSIDPRTGRVLGATEELFPRLPSAGLLIEF